jgi:hypothetical protein
MVGSSPSGSCLEPHFEYAQAEAREKQPDMWIIDGSLFAAAQAIIRARS